MSEPKRDRLSRLVTIFWSDESKTGSATGDWQRALKGVFKEAKIPDGHAHLFRDTFAMGLLQAGVPMDRVSALLGHSSIKVTEKHYSPWVRARQEQLEADVRRGWQQGFREAPKVQGTVALQGPIPSKEGLGM